MSIVGGRYRHGLRRMVAREVDETGRTATPLELLFDLTFVAAFGVAGSELAHGIAEGHWLEATIAFVFAMFSLVWAWINVNWFASAFDNDDWLYRLLTMVQMAGVIVLAIGLPALFSSIGHGDVFDNRLMVAGYVVMRIALVMQWLRAVRSEPRYRASAITYAVFVGTAQVGWVLLAVLELRPVAGLLGALALLAIEILGPVVAERRGGRSGAATPWHPHHLAERYALLTIIALGETVLGTLSSASVIADEGWSVDAAVTVAVGVAMSFALWWIYFLVPHATLLESRRSKAILWGYGHVLLFTAIAAVGAGFHLVGYLRDPHYELAPTAVVTAIGIPVAVFLGVRFLLHAWLVSALPPGRVVQLAAVLLPVLATALAAAGVPVGVCLLIVLAAPVSIVAWFELGGWRALDAQLARAATPRD